MILANRVVADSDLDINTQDVISRITCHLIELLSRLIYRFVEDCGIKGLGAQNQKACNDGENEAGDSKTLATVPALANPSYSHDSKDESNQGNKEGGIIYDGHKRCCRGNDSQNEGGNRKTGPWLVGVCLNAVHGFLLIR